MEDVFEVFLDAKTPDCSELLLSLNLRWLSAYRSGTGMRRRICPGRDLSAPVSSSPPSRCPSWDVCSVCASVCLPGICSQSRLPTLGYRPWSSGGQRK